MTLLLKTIEEQHRSAVYAKVEAGLLLGFSALLCCVVPIILIKKCGKSTSQTALDIMLRIGGGILIATTFLHLLPETREGAEALAKEDSLPSWPVEIPELIMCIGFFMMYLVEECAHICLSHGKHSGNEGHSHAVTGTPLRGILIVIALSTHQVFEGLAVGLESDDVKAIWIVTGAIAAHKLVIAVCVGAEMASSATSSFTNALCVGIFAIATPIGIGLGIALSYGKNEHELTINVISVILQGLATGTLLYVVFFEILTTNKEKGGLHYFFATAFGFIIMLILLWFFQS